MPVSKNSSQETRSGCFSIEKKLNCKQQIFTIETTPFGDCSRPRLPQSLYRRCELHIVGSSCTGFACDTSDVDMCLFLTEARIEQQHEATRILAEVERLLAKGPSPPVLLAVLFCSQC